MADFLKIGDTPIPIEYPDGASKDEPIEIGDRGRALAGNALTSIRALKNVWPFRTKWITRAEADSVIALLVATPPIECSGEALGGEFDCTAKLLGEDITTSGQGRRFRVKFRLEEE